MSSEFPVRLTRSPDAVLHEGRRVPEYVLALGEKEERSEDSPEFREGYAAGRAESRASLQNLLARLDGEIESLETFRKEMLERVEGNIVDLALAVSQKLLHQEIDEGRFRAGEIVRGLLKSLDLDADDTKVRVRANPADLEDLRSGGEEGSPIEGLERVEFTEDESLDRGCFGIESDFGKVTYDVERQLGELRDYLEPGETE